MFSRLSLVAVIATLLALTVASPATANDRPLAGTRIGLVGVSSLSFPANTPFYIAHGFACQLGDSSCMAERISAHSRFELSVDGVLQPSTVDINNFNQSLSKLYLTNYWVGMPAGTYVFVGTWIEDGTVALTRTVAITFI